MFLDFGLGKVVDAKYKPMFDRIYAIDDTNEEGSLKKAKLIKELYAEMESDLDKLLTIWS